MSFSDVLDARREAGMRQRHHRVCRQESVDLSSRQPYRVSGAVGMLTS